MKQLSTATVLATCSTAGTSPFGLHGGVSATDHFTTRKALRLSSPTALASRSALEFITDVDLDLFPFFISVCAILLPNIFKGTLI